MQLQIGTGVVLLLCHKTVDIGLGDPHAGLHLAITQTLEGQLLADVGAKLFHTQALLPQRCVHLIQSELVLAGHIQLSLVHLR